MLCIVERLPLFWSFTQFEVYIQEEAHHNLGSHGYIVEDMVESLYEDMVHSAVSNV
jgi:hypothetical protein